MKVIIFGDREMAELANYYLDVDSKHEVECFTVHDAFMTKDTFCEKPVIPFERLVETHPPSKYRFFAPIYPRGMGGTKAKICRDIRGYGYQFINYISSKAWTWNSKIGSNCFILEGCNIQPFSRIGDDVTIWSCSHIGHHSVVENNVFISGNVVIAGHNTIGTKSFMGSNCTTREHMVIPQGSFIAQDASVTKPPHRDWGMWAGVPATFRKDSRDIEL